MEEMNARVMENEVMDETVEVDEAVDSGNAGALVAGIVGGFLAYAVIGGAKKLWGFAGAKLAERKAARKAGTDAVDVEYADVEETAEDSDEGTLKSKQKRGSPGESTCFRCFPFLLLKGENCIMRGILKNTLLLLGGMALGEPGDTESDPVCRGKQVRPCEVRRAHLWDRGGRRAGAGRAQDPSSAPTATQRRRICMSWPAPTISNTR